MRCLINTTQIRTLWHLVWISWWQHPRQANWPLLLQRLDSPSTQTHNSEPSAFFCLFFFPATQTHTPTHLNTNISSGNRCDFREESSFSSATHCFLSHWPLRLRLVIELVGRRQHGLLPLLETVSYTLPTFTASKYYPNVQAKTRYYKWKKNMSWKRKTQD